MVTLDLADERSLSGRIVSRDELNTRIATQLMRPTESETVPNTIIRKSTVHPVSTMPSSLLNALNEEELLELLAYVTGNVRRPLRTNEGSDAGAFNEIEPAPYAVGYGRRC
jgi:hypothetical protein